MRAVKLSQKIAGIFVVGLAFYAQANPTGMTVASGSATSSSSGSRLTITTSQTALLNWQSFNIAAGETTIFNQPSVSSVVMNNIHDANASQIFGNLEANGIVVLMNPNGIYFGPNSYVQTAGLIVSTAGYVPPASGGNGVWEFSGPPPLASIINYGQINVGNGGSAFLIANNILNYGSITAPGGSIGLAAGKEVLLSTRPDGRGLSMAVTLPSGSVDNEGRLVADAGTIALNAQVVNQNGVVQANSAIEQNGVVELVASDQLNMGANSQISANGGNSAGGSPGGTVTLQSGGTYSDATGSQISATGGSQGGNGGSVEVSAPSILSLNSSVDTAAQTGWSSGLFALDPVNIVLGTSGSTGAGTSGTINGSSGSGTLNVNVNTAFENITSGQILLEASGNITLNANTAWNLSASTKQSTGQLTMEAGGNIIFGTGSSILDPNNWSVTLDAGYNFANNTIQTGTGNIYLNGGSGGTGNGFIQTTGGNINLAAGKNITVGSGYVITKGDGSIYAHALAGNIDCGSDAQGYHFVGNANSVNNAATFQNGLGGISTEAGGDVTLIAGGNVSSVLPGDGVYYYDGSTETKISNGKDYLTAGSGAYGSEPGNVTVVAGGNVTGNYLVANGTGNIYAGVDMDASGNPIMNASGNYVLGAAGNAGTDSGSHALALDLVSGGWNVDAAQNIMLEEVCNPNGVFDTSGTYKNYFNYSPGAFVNLSAGNEVQMGSANEPPNAILTGSGSAEFIYPPILNITAGGNVILGNPNTSSTTLVLFPSPLGSLTIDTLGSLLNGSSTSGTSPQLFNLIVSDAGNSQYSAADNFGTADVATTPIHINSPTPIDLDIGGNMEFINLSVPEAAQINVGGNMVNCGFSGLNLSLASGYQVPVTEANGSTVMFAVDPGVTSIGVTGEIYNRGNFTTLAGVTPAQAANLYYLAEAVNTSIPASQLANSFYYDAATETLTYQNIGGSSLSSVLNLLNSLTVQEYINGVPQWANAPSDTVAKPAPVPVSVLGNPATPGTVAYELLAQYNSLPPLPNGTFGYTIAGGGQFNITAQTLDLGTSQGIQSYGVGLNINGKYPLASLFGIGGVFNQGANVNVTTTGNTSEGVTSYGDLMGDVDMFASSINSLGGGNISITAGGNVNAGSPNFTVNSSGAFGIYTTSGGDISVIANDDVNVNGSRIATYDGGNITVESLYGDVNAGSGSSTPVGVTGFYENPVTHTVYTTSPQIPFSGILALTLPEDPGYPESTPILGNILVEAPNGNINANAAGILQIPLNNVDYPDAVVTILAGLELCNSSGLPVFAADSQEPVIESIPVDQADLNDPAGTIILNGIAYHNTAATTRAQLLALLGIPIDTQVVDLKTIGDANILEQILGGGNVGSILPNTINYYSFVSPGKDINVNGSGVIASNVRLDGSGAVNGLIFSRNNLNIVGPTVTVQALAGNKADVVGDTIKGTITGVGGVDAQGLDVTASLISAIVSGGTSGQSGLGQGTSANATAQSMANTATTAATAATSDQNDDQKKKKGKEVALAQKVSRVTVILPPKKLTETETPIHHS
jgi:filamentous hemagglutinin family protein